MLQTLLESFTPTDWSSTLETVLADVHEVDRDATRIWCAFFPLNLADAYASADNPQSVTRRLRIDGDPRLVSDQIDTSHWFLYGHRYWPAATASVIARAERAPTGAATGLTEIVRGVIADVAERACSDVSLVGGIAFVALMTLRQVGLDAFRASSPGHAEAEVASSESPDEIVATRARDDRQGVLKFVRGAKRFSIVFDERRLDARFPIVDTQHLTTAAAADTRDYTRGPRRFQEGPIPAQCRSATCGTCWIGVLGGREKLSAIEPYEARRLREFGYIDPEVPHPFIRLACQARASGNVTIVIPSWHGFVARLIATPPPASSEGAAR